MGGWMNELRGDTGTTDLYVTQCNVMQSSQIQRKEQKTAQNIIISVSRNLQPTVFFLFQKAAKV